MRTLTLLSLLILSLTPGAGPAYGADKNVLYRYMDEQGEVVLNDKLPPEAAISGYDVISRSGRVIKSVSGKPTEEELRRLDEEKVRKEEAKRLQEWDESLLLRYSEVEEIEAAKKRALKDIELRITILQSNLRQLKRQVEEMQERAADSEQATDKVPEDIEKIIRELKWNISDVEEMIARRRQELKETSASYDRDINRFKILRSRLGERAAPAPESDG